MRSEHKPLSLSPPSVFATEPVDPHDSLVGQVDKAVLLAAVDQLSVERSPTEAEFADQLRQLAGEEDISACQRAIALWMQQRDLKSISLLQLQQALKMPLIEVWLGLLLGEQEQYQWETSGEFYHSVEEIWLSTKTAHLSYPRRCYGILEERE